jgi:hypothetical protein
MREDLKDVVEKAAQVLKAKIVGVTTTIQHVHKLDQALEALKRHGIQGVVGPAGGRVRQAGQVLGCSYSTARALNVEEYLFIGTGQFHPLGIALATGKRVVIADPVTGEVAEIDTDPMLRRRFGAITRAGVAKRFAILVSKKPGQKRMALAERLKALGEARGLEMFVVYLDNICSTWGLRRRCPRPAPGWRWTMLPNIEYPYSRRPNSRCCWGRESGRNMSLMRLNDTMIQSDKLKSRSIYRRQGSAPVRVGGSEAHGGRGGGMRGYERKVAERT